MRNSIERDLEAACTGVEALLQRMPKMSREERIDVVARLRGAAKSITLMDEAVKDEVKTSLRHRMGEVPGQMFKAILNIFPVTRLDQTQLKVEHPRVHASCCVTTEQEKVTFEIR